MVSVHNSMAVMMTVTVARNRGADDVGDDHDDDDDEDDDNDVEDVCVDDGEGDEAGLMADAKSVTMRVSFTVVQAALISASGQSVLGLGLWPY